MKTDKCEQKNRNANRFVRIEQTKCPVTNNGCDGAAALRPQCLKCCSRARTTDCASRAFVKEITDEFIKENSTNTRAHTQHRRRGSAAADHSSAARAKLLQFYIGFIFSIQLHTARRRMHVRILPREERCIGAVLIADLVRSGHPCVP